MTALFVFLGWYFIGLVSTLWMHFVYEDNQELKLKDVPVTLFVSLCGVCSAVVAVILTLEKMTDDSVWRDKVVFRRPW